jgi:hypothetical protein
VPDACPQKTAVRGPLRLLSVAFRALVLKEITDGAMQKCAQLVDCFQVDSRCGLVVKQRDRIPVKAGQDLGWLKV